MEVNEKYKVKEILNKKEKKIIKDMYIKQKKSMQEIGKKFNVNRITIKNWNNKYNLFKIRNRKECQLTPNLKKLLSTQKQGKKNPKYSHGFYTNRKILFEKYGRKCQECGETKGKILVHHKKSVPNEPNITGDSSLKNLEILCAKCHAKTYPVAKNLWRNKK
jgi:5-methylcytosine-specific restriction endonuclease McrA